MMKTLRLISIVLLTAPPISAAATIFIAETVSVPVARGTGTGIDEVTFEWENAMVLAAADPCASYLAPRYNPGSHEGNYDDDGNDLRI